MNKAMLTVGIILLAVMSLLLINVLTNYQVVNGLDESFTNIVFNGYRDQEYKLYQTLTTVLKGYTFLGWYISVGSALTDEQIENITQLAITHPKYLNQYFYLPVVLIAVLFL